MDAATKKTAAKHITTRIAAIRAELSELTGSTSATAPVMVRALKRDLFEQECRLAEVWS